jgi:hypothetical protein
MDFSYIIFSENNIIQCRRLIKNDNPVSAPDFQNSVIKPLVMGQISKLMLSKIKRSQFMPINV